jgi:prolyl oligopeptidase
MQQAQFIVRARAGGAERVLFDPKASMENGTEPSIAEVWVSPDGSKVAIATQLGGAEEETIHVIDVDSGVFSDVIPHVGGALSEVALAWDANERGFIHTAWPKKSDGTYATSGMIVVHHVIGSDAAKDSYVFGTGMSPKAEYELLSSRDGAEQAIFETDGDGVHGSIFMRRNGRFVRVASPASAIGDSQDATISFVGHDLFVISKKNNSFGTVLSIAPNATIDSARVVVPPSNVVVEGAAPVKGGFMTLDIDGGDDEIRSFAADGTVRARVPLPPISSIYGLASDVEDGSVVIDYANYTTPSTYVSYDAKTNTLRPAGIEAESASGDFSQVEVQRVFVPSLDGKVRIPLEIVRAKNAALDGTAPTILEAYGSYGTISSPYYLSSRLPWLERGGVYAQAMIRGGGEYGDAWHKAARLSTKTVSSDDLAACARWLETHGYGNASHLGISGASAGGFLMGLAMTRNPELYRAVQSDVGIYDLLRFELTNNGAYNTPEFGTVKDPKQFPFMLAQSPYDNVVAGRAYPAILMMTGENDQRVDPYNSRKMIARLQADSTSGLPILLVQKAGEGHGIGNSTDQAIDAAATGYTFFDSQLR